MSDSKKPSFVCEIPLKVTQADERKLERSRRANNPGNYEPNGTIKKGQLKWNNSGSYETTRDRLAELHRKQAEHRKSLHGNTVNRILSLGDRVKLEKVSYRSFQRNYGKSVAFRGPGAFVSQLKRKAVNAGVEVIEFSTQTTRLSQVCLCGAVKKKALSQRWHMCDCGLGPVQRDLFSAWLAKYLVNDRLDAGRARCAWPGVEALLQAASRQIEPAMGQGQSKPNPATGRSRSPAQSGEDGGEACCGAMHGRGMRASNRPEPPHFIVPMSFGIVLGGCSGK